MSTECQYFRNVFKQTKISISELTFPAQVFGLFGGALAADRAGIQHPLGRLFRFQVAEIIQVDSQWDSHQK